MNTSKTRSLSSTLPWWRHGHVWLVVAGPAAVVVAATFTAWIAFTGADVPLQEARVVRSLESLRASPVDRSLAPALVGRNHAVTPDHGVVRP